MPRRGAGLQVLAAGAGGNSRAGERHAGTEARRLDAAAHPIAEEIIMTDNTIVTPIDHQSWRLMHVPLDVMFEIREGRALITLRYFEYTWFVIWGADLAKTAKVSEVIASATAEHLAWRMIERMPAPWLVPIDSRERAQVEAEVRQVKDLLAVIEELGL